MILTEKPMIGISLDALFDVNKAKAIMRESIKGPKDDIRMICPQGVPPGVAFPLVQKLLALKHPGTHASLLDVTVFTKDTGIEGILGYQGIKCHQLDISRIAFTREQKITQYIREFKIDLLLSWHEDEVTQAMNGHCAAAMLIRSSNEVSGVQEIKIAFDADAMLYRHDAECVSHALTLAPFKKFLAMLHRVQKYASAELCPIRIALMSEHKDHGYQATHYLRQYGVRVDETLFLNGLAKAHFLKTFGAELFFHGKFV